MTIKTGFDISIDINQTNVASIDIGYTLDTIDTLDFDYVYHTHYIHYI